MVAEYIDSKKVYNNFNYDIHKSNYYFEFETYINKYEEILNPFAFIILLGWVNKNLFVLLIPNKRHKRQ